MSRKVFIFDDDKDIRDVVSIILSNRDYVIRTAPDLLNFMEPVKLFNPDVILMDVMIPDIGGLEACRILKEAAETKEIPVIIFTAHDVEIEYIKKSYGVDDVLYKPFKIKNLLEKINGFGS